MTNRDNNQNKHTDAIIGTILIGISVLLLLILCGVFDPAGKYVKDFLTGVFGLSFYGITVGMLLIGVLKLFKFKLSVPVSRIIEVLGIYSLFILAFHATSYDYMTMTASYGEYITMCYKAADTAGGVFGAIVMYPLMLVHKVFAIVMVALLLFALIAFAMFRGKLNLGSMRTRSVKYDKRDKVEKATHVQVGNDLRNETIDGKQLGEIKTRSRFSKAQTEYVPIEEENIVEDDEFQINYKDKYAFDSSNVDDIVEDDIVVDKDNTPKSDTDTSENKFEKMRNDARLAHESLYGKDEDRAEAHFADSENTQMTDQEKFREAIERIRNNEDQSYLRNISSKKDDYEIYSIEARERIYRENLERERREKEAEAESKQDIELKNEDISENIEEEKVFNLDDIKIDDADSNNSYSFDSFDAFSEDKPSDEIIEEPVDMEDTTPIDDVEDNIEEAELTISDEDIPDEEVTSDENTQNDNVKDESVKYEIDDFSSSLDKTFKIKKNEDSPYNLPYYSRDEMYLRDKDEKKDRPRTEQPKINNINSSRVEDIERELLEDEKPKERKRRSDFGGTHNSQRIDEDELHEKAGEAINDKDNNDLSSFINPFAKKEEETRKVEATPEPVIEEEEPKTALVSDLHYKYKVPPIDLLKTYQNNSENNDENIEMQCRKIEQGLAGFDINAKVVKVVKGPTVSRIELEMERGSGKSVKAIKNLKSDIEYMLGCNGQIDIQAPIPGKSAIGIQVPNTIRRTVGLKEVFNSEIFNNKKWKIPFALGVDVENEAHVCDISKAPHMLMAGATGAGKSVGISCLLVSILYKCSPNDVKLILVDPKKVELNDYQGLPHMLVKDPITEPSKVLNMMDWLIAEMERRYDALCASHVSNIEEFNEAAVENGTPKMPFILLVVDELADIMAQLKKNLDDRIQRLAAKSRAAGIHMVIATQRPSVDVITGVIKSNLPARVAFAAAQPEDSRTILGTIGAEKLLRYGDMIYKDGATSMMDRIQGAFISKKEVIAITDYVRENNPADFDTSIQAFIDREQVVDEDDSPVTSPADISKPREQHYDELFKDALEIFIEANKATASLLQRKLEIGFPRAAKIVDQLIDCGFVSQDKKVLITHLQFMKMFGDDEQNEEE